MTGTLTHPLESLTAQEVQLAVSLLKELGKVTKTMRRVPCFRGRTRRDG